MMPKIVSFYTCISQCGPALFNIAAPLPSPPSQRKPDERNNHPPTSTPTPLASAPSTPAALLVALAAAAETEEGF